MASGSAGHLVIAEVVNFVAAIELRTAAAARPSCVILMNGVPAESCCEEEALLRWGLSVAAAFRHLDVVIGLGQMNEAGLHGLDHDAAAEIVPIDLGECRRELVGVDRADDDAFNSAAEPHAIP